MTDEQIQHVLDLLASLMEDYLDMHGVDALICKMRIIGFSEEDISEILVDYMPHDEMNT